MNTAVYPVSSPLKTPLKKLSGKSRDETDKDEPHIIELNTNEWIVLGKSDIDEVNEMISMAIPDINEYDTFSGYVLHSIGRLPAEKEEIPLGNYMITVEEKEGNRINKYIVKEITSVSPEESLDIQPENQ